MVWKYFKLIIFLGDGNGDGAYRKLFRRYAFYAVQSVLPTAPVIEEYLKAEDKTMDYPVTDAGVEGLKMFTRYPAAYDEGWSLQMGYTNESEISRDAIIVYQEKVGRSGTPVTKVLRTGFPGNHLNTPITTPVVHGNYKDDATTRYRILAVYCQ